MQEEICIFINNNNINKTNKKGRAGQGRAGQGRAGQDRTGQGRAGHKEYTAYNNEPTRDCKHREILKGAIEEGNE